MQYTQAPWSWEPAQPPNPRNGIIATKKQGWPEMRLENWLSVILPSKCCSARDPAYAAAGVRDSAGIIFTPTVNEWQNEESRNSLTITSEPCTQQKGFAPRAVSWLQVAVNLQPLATDCIRRIINFVFGVRKVPI